MNPVVAARRKGQSIRARCGCAAPAKPDVVRIADHYAWRRHHGQRADCSAVRSPFGDKAR